MEQKASNDSFFSFTARNKTYATPGLYDLNLEDATWVLTSSFIIFTMQTGFGMLESGCVSVKNTVNIMMKNIIDVVLGGFTYWVFGYGLSFGRSSYTNPFIAFGDFLIDPAPGDPLMGQMFAAFLFQLSFSTTATTIVSGAMAERCNFKAYCIFSFFNTIVYCLPAGWVWGEHGFLKKMGCVDIAGSGPVHLVGGASAFASAAMLGPRLGRYQNGSAPLPLGNPVNACMGLFVLWWGWLAFNSGSTYGVSGKKWGYAARGAVMTMMGSFGGGMFSVFYSFFRNDGKLDILDLINGVLGSLVSVTAGCYLYNGWDAIAVGFIGSIFACFSMPLFDKMRVDDPVGASSVHGVCGMWGVLAVGFFANNPIGLDTTNGRKGLFKGGGSYLLGIQSLTALCLMSWSLSTTFFLLFFINKVVPIRMTANEELLGADLVEHKIRHSSIGISRALSALVPGNEELEEFNGVPTVGQNPGHLGIINDMRAATKKIREWKSFMETRSTSVRKSIEKRNSVWSGTIREAIRRQSTKTGDIPYNGNDDDSIIRTISDGKLKPGLEQNYAWID